LFIQFYKNSQNMFCLVDYKILPLGNTTSHHELKYFVQHYPSKNVWLTCLEINT
jgi:hypothetical protein